MAHRPSIYCELHAMASNQATTDISSTSGKIDVADAATAAVLAVVVVIAKASQEPPISALKSASFSPYLIVLSLVRFG